MKKAKDIVKAVKKEGYKRIVVTKTGGFALIENIKAEAEKVGLDFQISNIGEDVKQGVEYYAIRKK